MPSLEAGLVLDHVTKLNYQEPTLLGGARVRTSSLGDTWNKEAKNYELEVGNMSQLGSCIVLLCFKQRWFTRLLCPCLPWLPLCPILLLHLLPSRPAHGEVPVDSNNTPENKHDPCQGG